MRGLLVGEDHRVADWAFKSFNLFPSQYNHAIGVIEPTGKLVGAILFQCFNGNNVELSYYGRQTMSPGIIRAIARLVTVGMNVSRLTAVTSKRNKKMVLAMQRLGFRFECAQRCYYGHRDTTRNTGIRLVMFRDRLDQIARNKQCSVPHHPALLQAR